jgi:anti-anti-sigma factor
MSRDGSEDHADGDDSGHGPGVVPAAVLWLMGELDIAEAGLTRRQLLAHIRATKDTEVVVDMSEVTFLDCAGLEPLVSADRWLVRHDRRLVLRSISARVEFLFTGLRRAGLVFPFEQAGRSESTPEDLTDDVAEDLDLAYDADLVHLIDGVQAAGVARLRRTFEGRPLIDQATGLLMAVHECAADEALGLLTRIAEQHDMTTGDLAGGLAGLAAARGGRSTLDLSSAMKAAVRGVLAHPGRSPAAVAGPGPRPEP